MLSVRLLVCACCVCHPIGAGEWDSPPNNFHVNSAGSWRVENGNVRQA